MDAIKICKTCGRQYVQPTDLFINTSRWRVCEEGHMWFNCSCLSTLVLIKGAKFFDVNHVLGGERAALFRTLFEGKRFPFIPSYIQQLCLDLANLDVDNKAIADKILSFPLFAVELLSVANSLRSAQVKPIESVSHALTFLGRARVCSLANYIAARSVDFKAGKEAYDEHWDDSYLCGLIAKDIAANVPGIRLDPEQAFLVGSMCNLGKVISAHSFPDQYIQVRERINTLSTQTNWFSAEQDLQAADHCALGEIAGTLWGLPQFICDSFQHHGEHGRFQELDANFTASLANQLCHWAKGQPHRQDDEFFARLVSYRNLSDGDLQQIVDRSLRELERLKAEVIS